jgi:hypothetical protein
MTTPTLAQRTPYAQQWQPDDGEPCDTTIAFLAHPHDHSPMQAFVRNDASAVESGYAVDEDDGLPSGRRWYEVVDFPDAPDTWADVVNGHDGPIFVVRICAPVGYVGRQPTPDD